MSIRKIKTCMTKNHKSWFSGKENGLAEYKKKFLTERLAKDRMAIYVDKDIYEKVKFVVGMSDGKEQTYGGFVSAVLEEHLKDHSDTIRAIYNEHQTDVLSLLDN